MRNLKKKKHHRIKYTRSANYIYEMVKIAVIKIKLNNMGVIEFLIPMELIARDFTFKNVDFQLLHLYFIHTFIYTYLYILSQIINAYIVYNYLFIHIFVLYIIWYLNIVIYIQIMLKKFWFFKGTFNFLIIDITFYYISYTYIFFIYMVYCIAIYI